MVRRRLCWMVAVLLLIGCEGGGAGPDPDPLSDLASIAITSSHVVTLTPGEEIVLEVFGRRHDGKPFQGNLPVQWRVEDGSRATIGPDGALRASSALGHSWVFGTVEDLQDSVALWVQKPESEPSSFQITLLFAEEVPDWWRVALEEAARRWEGVIRDKLPPVDVGTLQDYCGTVPGSDFEGDREGMEDGVRIEVLVSGAFPPGTYVEAVGGPCMHRGLPRPTTVLGRITLNRDHFADGTTEGRLRYVAHHEMGHTFGLAGVIQGAQPPWLDADRGLYRGHLALYGHYLDTGEPLSEISFASGSHWAVTSLMGVKPSLELKKLSVGSLMDLGYPAAWYGAGGIDSVSNSLSGLALDSGLDRF